MNRRILVTIVGITAFAVAVFVIALGVVVSHLFRDQAVNRLQRDANSAGLEIPSPLQSSSDPIELPTLRDGAHLAVYDPSGARVAGQGPDRADPPVRRATAGPLTSSSAHGSIVVAVPIFDHEQVYAVVRASMPSSVVDARVHRAWLLMAALALFVIGGAAVIARRQAKRLSRPVTALTEAAARLGDGDFALRTERSGIGELDAAGAALEATAQRLGDLLQRERSFTADASHQLRTPLTALRVQLESAAMTPNGDVRAALEDALQTIDQIQATIEDLLALGRDVAARGPCEVRPVLDEIERRWRGPLGDAQRALEIRVEPELPAPLVSDAALRQILDVLVANAHEHGDGTVTIAARAAGGGVAIEVSDEGDGVTEADGDVFARRTDAGVDRGIGLALARSLAEAEGGRLLLRARGPHPTFRLLLSASDPIDAPPTTVDPAELEPRETQLTVG